MVLTSPGLQNLILCCVRERRDLQKARHIPAHSMVQIGSHRQNPRHSSTSLRRSDPSEPRGDPTRIAGRGSQALPWSAIAQGDWFSGRRDGL
jgi:hypothetical protein